MIKEKIVYKIWDKKNNKFICPNGKKSQWNSLSWATAALREIIKPDWGHVLLNNDPENFKIQAFKLVMVESWPGKEVYESNEKRIQELINSREKISKIEKEICNLVPNVAFWQIQEMYKKGVLSDIISKKIKILFIEFYKLKSKFK